MVFPTSPSNGQQITVANITYEYNSTKAAWYRIISVSNGNISISVGNIVTGNVYSSNYYFANGAPFTSSNYGDSNVAAYLTSTYPITNDGALRIGIGSGPDVYVDALNDIYLGHGGTNYTTVNVDGRATFSSNATFTANATFSSGANLTVNNTSNITVKSGAGLHLQSGATLIADTGTFVGNVATGNVSATGFYFANGTPFISGSGSSTYGNANVAAYLPTYTGNISAGNIVTTGTVVGGGVRYTVSATPPANPVAGDTWFDTTTDTLLRYVSDGTSAYWIDYSNSNVQLQTYGNTEVSSLLSTYTGNISAGNISVGGTLYVSGNIVPTVSNTLNIGSSTMRFGSLFLSGNTIYLGNTVITEDTQLGTITFIPPSTPSNPNPTAVIFTSNGSISAAQTVAGNITANAATPNFANLTATSIYSTSYFYANGTAFVGGGGGLDNLDGGTPYSVYGGLTTIDGGGVV